jgi:hypothetical protein
MSYIHFGLGFIYMCREVNFVVYEVAYRWIHIDKTPTTVKIEIVLKVEEKNLTTIRPIWIFMFII